MYSKGDIVIVRFPFSDLVQFKKRPMLVIGEKGDDIIGCAITSNPESEGVAIIKFEEGSLPLQSKIKYWQIHTIEKTVIEKKIAQISKSTQRETIIKINELIKI